MAVADFLQKVGSGLEKGLSTAGKVAGAVLPAVANEEAGYAPADHQHQQKQEDAQIAVKAQELETQLETGRKYGTLTPEQQQQYVDAISGLYSHPRHAGTLMEKLRKAVHPNGAKANPGSLATLKNATPQGGTAAEDERLKAENLKSTQALHEQYGEELAEKKAQIAAKYHKPAGKSPPSPGNQLPPDAIGADGQPIPQEARDAAHSFVEWNGSWWPVAKAKPVIKTIAGRSVLIDPQTGNKLRDLGAAGEIKTTTRQTLQPGDDGQMHLVNLTSVTAPGGEQIQVEPESGSESGGAETKPPVPAPKKSVGGILPKAQPKPVTMPPGGPSAGKVVPGLSTLARSKNPVYKADTATYKKVNDDAISKKQAYSNATAAANAPTPTSDTELIYSWVRSNVQGAGRMTQAEFKQAGGIGSVPLKAENWASLATSGLMTPQLRKYMLSDLKRSADTSQKQAEELRNGLQPGDTPKDKGKEINYKIVNGELVPDASPSN